MFRNEQARNKMRLTYSTIQKRFPFTVINFPNTIWNIHIIKIIVPHSTCIILSLFHFEVVLCAVKVLILIIVITNFFFI